jgi:hypothetical protein
MALPVEISATVRKKIRRYFAEREAGRLAYRRSDRLLAEIARNLTPGVPVQLDGREVILVDLFAGKDVVFRPCGVRRFELEWVE